MDQSNPHESSANPGEPAPERPAPATSGPAAEADLLPIRIPPLYYSMLFIAVGAFAIAALSILPRPDLSGLKELEAPPDRPAHGEPAVSSEHEAPDTFWPDQEPATPAALQATFVYAAIVFGGFLGFLFIVATGRLPGYFKRTPYPLPALGIFDIAGAFLLWQAMVVGLYLGLGHLFAGELKQADRVTATVFGMLVQFTGYACALPLLILLARLRGGPQGALGLWPFWRNPRSEPPSDVLGDLRTGIGTWLTVFWFIVAAMAINGLVVTKLMKQPLDQNQMIEVFSKGLEADRTVAILVIFVCAGFGAAFFEEILFRGVLYNALKRHAGVWPAAIISSLGFAVIHRVWAQVLPLFVIGLLMVYLYERTGRLLAPMAAHAANNLFMLGLLFWMQGG